MRRFIALSALLAGSLVAFPFDAAGGDGGALILSKNPQLSKIPDWSQVTGVGEPDDCNKAGMQESVDSMRKRGETAYRCVAVQIRFGGQPWESGSGESVIYQLQLHPNSPMVWKVNKTDRVRLIALIAEFDATGKLLFSQSARSPTKLLTDAQGTGGTTPAQQPGLSGNVGPRGPGESHRDCMFRLALLRGASQNANMSDCGCSNLTTLGLSYAQIETLKSECAKGRQEGELEYARRPRGTQSR